MRRLVAIAGRFSIDGPEAEWLADDVLSLILLSDDGGGLNPDDRLDRLMAVTCVRRNAAAIVEGLDPRKLWTILPLLPAHTRRVLQLHVVEGRDANEIAAIMEVSRTYAARLIAKSVARAKKAILEWR